MKFLDFIVRVVASLATGLDGNETAKIKQHKLRFWLFGIRLYKVWSLKTNKEFYIITKEKLPKYKYKSFTIHGGVKRLTDYLFIWRTK